MTWLALVGVVGLAGLAIAVAVWLRRRFVVVDVHGKSMEPTFHDGDRVLVRRVRLSRIRDGDVVVLEAPPPRVLEADAVPEHLLELPEWDLPPEEVPLPEPALPERAAAQDAALGQQLGGPQWIIKRAAAVPGSPVPGSVWKVVGAEAGAVVPEGRFVALGDNADHSHDSRDHGYYDADHLLGVVVRPMGR